MNFFYDSYVQTIEDDVVFARRSPAGGRPIVEALDGDDLVLAGMDLFFPTRGTNFIGLTRQTAYSLEASSAQWTTFENPMVEDSSIPHLTIVHEPNAGSGRVWWSLTVGAGKEIVIDVDSWGSVAVGSMLTLTEPQVGNVVDYSSGSAITDGGEGSRFTTDPFLRFTTEVAGTYFISLGPPTGETFDGSEVLIVNISVEGHVAGNSAYAFDLLEASGGSGADLLIGGSGDQTLWGGDSVTEEDGSIDRLVGGTGDDTYHIGANDVVVEQSSGGNDTVYFYGSDFDGRLTTNVETIHVISSSGQNSIIAPANDATIWGTAQDDIFTGGLGSASMRGGNGWDEYYLTTAGDIVIEMEDEGYDRVYLSGTLASYTLPDNVEELAVILGNGSTVFDYTGNGGDNAISIRTDPSVATFGPGQISIAADGGPGNDYIYLRLVAPSLEGGPQFTFVEGGTGDDAIEGAPSAINTLHGDDGDDTLIGGSNEDTLRGGTGADRMEGRAGDDTYVVDNPGDTILELADGGEDSLVLETAVYTVPAHVEVIYTPLDLAFDVTGNDQANRFISLLNADDVVRGKGGDDSYRISDAGAQIIEEAGEGIDTVFTRVSYTLPDHVENLIRESSSGTITLTGNDLDNELRGFSNDTIYGLGGNDTLLGAAYMAGGTGDDTYLVDAGETPDIVELVGEGFDTVYYYGFASDLPANVEEFRIVSSANGSIFGTAGDDRFIFEAGADNKTLYAGAGNDFIDVRAVTSGAITIIADEGDDTIYAGNFVTQINLGSGADTVYVSGGSVRVTVGGSSDVITRLQPGATLRVTVDNTYWEATTQVDEVQLMRSAHYVGTSGVDVVYMIDFDDTVEGGAGDDVYHVDDQSAVLIENPGEGYDTAHASSASFTLPENFEALVAEGTGQLLNGNELDNTISAIRGKDHTLSGGAGDDFYRIGFNPSAVVELAGEGFDTIQAGSLSYTLPDHVEKLMGAGYAQTLTGNALDNIIEALGGNHTLDGGEGDDILDGGAGNDTMLGGLGNDLFYVDSTGDVVTELAGEGTDKVFTAVDLNTKNAAWANIETFELIGAASRIVGNTADNELVANATLGTVMKGLTGDDIMIGGAERDIMNGGGGLDHLMGNDGADLLDGRNANDLIEGGGGKDELLGGKGADTIFGGGGRDVLDGGSDDDVLLGEGGDDMLIGGAGRDVMTGGGEADSFVFRDGDMAGTTSASADRILDFSTADGDIIDLSGLDAILGGGDDAFAYVGNAAFSNTAGEVRWEHKGGNTLIFMDIDGDSVTDYAIRLNGEITLSAADFVL